MFFFSSVETINYVTTIQMCDEHFFNEIKKKNIVKSTQNAVSNYTT